MVSFGSIVKGLAVFSLFFGILSSMAMDILSIIANPFSPEPYKNFAVDVGKVFLNSQTVISTSIKEFSEAETLEYKNFLLWKIIGASLVCLVLIWLIYKGLRWLVPGASQDLGAKLLIIIVSLALVWFVGVLTSITLGEGFLYPYSGWVDLAREREVLIEFILEHYSQKTG